LIVAIMVLSVGVLALAGTAAVVSRQTGGGTQQTLAASVAASRLEDLRARRCSDITSATADTVTRGVRERWRITAGSAAQRRFEIENTVTYQPAGRRAVSFTFRGFVTCQP
jgi:Tfp pilus assembly protein PilV